MDNNDGSTFFRGELYDNFAENKLPQAADAGYETVLKPSATTRTTFELDISETHIRFGMPAQNLWWIDTDVPALSWGRGVVQLAQHSYNPSKACDYNGSCGPNTWHWDNVSISPAVPFAIDHGTSRFVSPEEGPGGVSFSSPAPPNSFLRFSAIGNASVSFDGGHTWRDAARQAQELSDPSHYSSFWMPIPAGTQTVQLRFSDDDWYDGPFRAQDFAIWTAPG